LATASIAEVIRRGRRHVSPRLTLCVLSGNEALAKPAAWSIQKRFLKSAVLRNAVKRQLRECVRQREIAAGTQFVFMGRKAFLDGPAAKRDLKRTIRAEAESLLNRIKPLA
jgi:ribonuclease P protein component